MNGDNVEGLICELEETIHKPDFFGKLENFNETFIEKFKKNKDSVDDKGSFPFGTIVPEGPLVRPSPTIVYPVIQTVYYVPYYPPKAKEVYPYGEELKDLEYWKEKRKEFSKFLQDF